MSTTKVWSRGSEESHCRCPTRPTAGATCPRFRGVCTSSESQTLTFNFLCSPLRKRRRRRPRRRSRSRVIQPPARPSMPITDASTRSPLPNSSLRAGGIEDGGSFEPTPRHAVASTLAASRALGRKPAHRGRRRAPASPSNPLCRAVHRRARARALQLSTSTNQGPSNSPSLSIHSAGSAASADHTTRGETALFDLSLDKRCPLRSPMGRMAETKPLIIVESPAKARTISQFLGSD